MRSHPYLLSFSPFLSTVVYLSLIILPAGSLLPLLYPNFCLDLWWVRLQLARGDAVHERANCSDSVRASASVDAVSRERFIPAVAADAVTPTYLRATVEDFHPAHL